MSVKLGRGGLVNGSAGEHSLSPFHPYGEDTTVTGPGFSVTAKGADFVYEEGGKRFSSPGANSATGNPSYYNVMDYESSGGAYIVGAYRKTYTTTNGLPSAYVTDGKGGVTLYTPKLQQAIMNRGMTNGASYFQIGMNPSVVTVGDVQPVKYSSSNAQLIIGNNPLAQDKSLALVNSNDNLVYRKSIDNKKCVQYNQSRGGSGQCLKYQSYVTYEDISVYEYKKFYANDSDYKLFSIGNVGQGSKKVGSWYGGPGGAIIEFWGTPIDSTCVAGLTGSNCPPGVVATTTATTTRTIDPTAATTTRMTGTSTAPIGGPAPVAPKNPRGTSTSPVAATSPDFDLSAASNIKIKAFRGGVSEEKTVSIIKNGAFPSDTPVKISISSDIPATHSPAYLMNGNQAQDSTDVNAGYFLVSLKLGSKIPDACGTSPASGCKQYKITITGTADVTVGSVVKTITKTAVIDVVQDSVSPGYQEV